MGVALRRTSSWALAALAVGAIALMVVVAQQSHTMSIDFHNEIYPQASLMLRGDNPYPPPGSDLTDGANYIWPPVAVFVAAPLTVLSPGSADIAAAILELIAFVAALWVVGVRDWRVYTASMLWPQVLGETRVAHYSLVLCLLVAVAWRTRGRTWAPGLAVGAAISLKFFVWPLVIWLVSLRRYRDAALAACLGAGSLLLVSAYTNPLDYLRVLRELGAAYDQDSYSPYGLVVQLGAPGVAGSAVTLALGLAFLAVAWQRRSFGLFVAACLVLSPIVWLDYYALLAVPLAIVRPRLGAVWLLPIVTWGIPSAGNGIGDVGHSLRLLIVFSVVLASIVRAERGPRTDLHPEGARTKLAPGRA